MTRSDEPFDLDAVAGDDAMVERLRASLSPGDSVGSADDSGDLSYALLRALQDDVSAELDPPPVVVPIGPRRRVFGRAATVAAVTAGVLSLAGAAAAATASPGAPLSGVRSAVASAVHDALDAITPSESVESPAAAPTEAGPAVSPRGEAVSAAARSAGATNQIEERIALAERLLDRGRLTAAGEVLDQAQRRLPLVQDAAKRAGYQEQIDRLRARALAAPARGPQSGPADVPGKSGDKRATPSPKPSRTAPQQQRRPSPPSSGPASGERSNRDVRLPHLPSPALSAQLEEHGAPKR